MINKNSKTSARKISPSLQLCRSSAASRPQLQISTRWKILGELKERKATSQQKHRQIHLEMSIGLSRQRLWEITVCTPDHPLSTIFTGTLCPIVINTGQTPS